MKNFGWAGKALAGENYYWCRKRACYIELETPKKDEKIKLKSIKAGKKTVKI